MPPEKSQMERIEIHLRELKAANQRMPSALSSIENIKRNVSLLRWRIPAEIQERRDIRVRLEAVLEELVSAEKKLQGIYTVTDSAITQYMNTDGELKKNAESFE